MNPVEFISAGAGSGKTYRLTNVLAEALESGSARPHAVLATTFTVKAATELRERARQWLLESGRLDLATAVGQARLGTVNSVCGQLLKRFCFEVGLSPDQTVLSEAQGKKLLVTALSDTLDETNRAELTALTHRFGIEDGDWAKAIGDIVRAARENDISADALRPMGATNADLMLANWPASEQGVDHTGRLVDALVEASAAARIAVEGLAATGAKVPKNMQDGAGELQDLLRAFRSDSWNWPTWIAACNIDAGAKLRAAVQPVSEAAQAHERHPQLHADVRRYLELVFALAADTLKTFARAKLDLGAVDFIDQELLLLQALRGSDEVRSALASELDLVMVDEFQDTSPLQLALFVEIAKLAKKSVWVGDPKQAIYGFRGTDATLIARIVEAIDGWGGTIGEPLTTSRRSTPALVSLANAVFVPAFGPDIAPQAVQLKPSREDIPNQISLHDWTFESRKAELDYLGLGPAITGLLTSGLQVQDKETKMLRPVGAGDIAVLCRTNAQIDRAVAALAHWNIPSASGRPGLLSTPEASLVVACLRRMQDPSDTLATALILSLAAGMPVREWLADRLGHVASGQPTQQWRTVGTDAHPLLARLEVLRPTLLSLTPLEALRLAKAESHVAMVASQWSTTPQQARLRIANVEALLDMGVTYEDECVSAKRPATVGGLLRWLAQQASDAEDSRAIASEDAVEVVTHHGAKGLEWPVVVLTGLGAGARTALWGVRARTNGAFDAQAPLQNRFVHYWPYPYGKRKMPQAAINAEDSEVGKAMANAGFEENKRLLYVSMTRARDAMVLVSTMKKAPARGWVDEVGASDLLFGGSGPLQLPDGLEILRDTKVWTSDECAAAPPTAIVSERRWFSRQEPGVPVPLWFRPSSAHGGNFSAAQLEQVGTRIAIAAKVDMSSLGTALHLCIARCGAAGSISHAEVEHILAGWGVAHAVSAEAVLNQVDALFKWISKRWPGCGFHVEAPIEVDLGDGRRLRGQIDLLVETSDGWVLIDHKANPSGAGSDDRLIQKHGQQLSSYANALERAPGRPVLEHWLFLPVAAQAVRVTTMTTGNSGREKISDFATE